jgi:hypothetical protein
MGEAAPTPGFRVAALLTTRKDTMMKPRQRFKYFKIVIIVWVSHSKVVARPFRIIFG